MDSPIVVKKESLSPIKKEANPERRSERSRKRKEYYSPERDVEDTPGKKRKGVRKKSVGLTLPNRPCDFLPNGEPFSCHLCLSPFVVNTGRQAKNAKRKGRSRHTPLPQTRTDKLTGKEIMLCNACAATLDKPQRQLPKTKTIPSEEEQRNYLKEAAEFGKSLVEQHNDPLAERLYCPGMKKKICGCIQKTARSTGAADFIPVLLTCMKEAEVLSKQKSYTSNSQSRQKKKGIGLGNGQKKSKKFEEFVLEKRRLLKDNYRLCERAAQKVLMYSNNFLFKRLKTENRPCRVERCRGKAFLGKLPELHTLVDLHCCTDNCVMVALTHRKLLQDWRERVKLGQKEARRVLAEMLTPAGALHVNCYQFISFVTGCSLSTIGSVYAQMVDTHGVRDPPEHGMKKVWENYYRENKTTHTDTATTESIDTAGKVDDVQTATSKTQEVTSELRMANHITITDSNVQYELQRQSLVRMQQEIAQKQHLLQQQQANLQLQLLAQQTTANTAATDEGQNSASVQQFLRQMVYQQQNSSGSPLEMVQIIPPLQQAAQQIHNQQQHNVNQSVQAAVDQSVIMGVNQSVSSSLNQSYPVILQHLQQPQKQPQPVQQINVNQSIGETSWNQSNTSVQSMTSLPVNVTLNQPGLSSNVSQSIPIQHPLSMQQITHSSPQFVQDIVLNGQPQNRPSQIMFSPIPQTVSIPFGQAQFIPNQSIQLQLVDENGTHSLDMSQSIPFQNMIGQSQGPIQFSVMNIPNNQATGNVQLVPPTMTSVQQHQIVQTKESPYQIKLVTNVDNGSQEYVKQPLEISINQENINSSLGSYEIELVPAEDGTTPDKAGYQTIVAGVPNISAPTPNFSNSDLQMLVAQQTVRESPKYETSSKTPVYIVSSNDSLGIVTQNTPSTSHLPNKDNNMKQTFSSESPFPVQLHRYSNTAVETGTRPTQVQVSFQPNVINTGNDGQTLQQTNLPNADVIPLPIMSRNIYEKETNVKVTSNADGHSRINRKNEMHNVEEPVSNKSKDVNVERRKSRQENDLDGFSVKSRNPSGNSLKSRNPSGNSVISRNPSGNSVKSRNPSGNSVKSRNPSGNLPKSRNPSGNSLKTILPMGSSSKSRQASTSSVRSREPSGNSVRSRQSSGNIPIAPSPSFDLFGKLKHAKDNYMENFSKIGSRSRQASGNTQLRESLKQLPISGGVKMKDRSRQCSGNSIIEERSRKSSGNSYFGESSVGFSNLSSPNIFLDKERGIYFIQSVGENGELCEIDSNLNIPEYGGHISDLIMNVQSVSDIDNLSHLEKVNQSVEIENTDETGKIISSHEPVHFENNFETSLKTSSRQRGERSKKEMTSTTSRLCPETDSFDYDEDSNDILHHGLYMHERGDSQKDLLYPSTNDTYATTGTRFITPATSHKNPLLNNLLTKTAKLGDL